MVNSFDSLLAYNDATAPDLKGKLKDFATGLISIPVEAVELSVKTAVYGLAANVPGGVNFVSQKAALIDAPKQKFLDGIGGGSIDLLGDSGLKWASDSTIAGLGETWDKIQTFLVTMITQLPGFESFGFQSDSMRMGKELLAMKSTNLAISSDLAPGLKRQFDAASVPDGQYSPPPAVVQAAVAHGIGIATLGGSEAWSDIKTIASNKMNHLFGGAEETQTPKELAAKIAFTVRGSVFQAAVRDQLGERTLAKLPQNEQEIILTRADHVAERYSGLCRQEATDKTIASNEHTGMFAYLQTKFTQINTAAAEPTLNLKSASVVAPTPPPATPAGEKSDTLGVKV